MNRDGSNLRQVTKLGGANFAPSWHPDGKRLIFASNIQDPKGRNFDIYMINVDGTGLERISFNDTFDGFPMFSPDGKKLVFASNRNAKAEGETNVFIPCSTRPSVPLSSLSPLCRSSVRKPLRRRAQASRSTSRISSSSPSAARTPRRISRRTERG